MKKVLLLTLAAAAWLSFATTTDAAGNSVAILPTHYQYLPTEPIAATVVLATPTTGDLRPEANVPVSLGGTSQLTSADGSVEFGTRPVGSYTLSATTPDGPVTITVAVVAPPPATSLSANQTPATVASTLPAAASTAREQSGSEASDGRPSSPSEQDWTAIATHDANRRGQTSPSDTVTDQERQLLVDAATNQATTPASQARQQAIKLASQPGGSVSNSAAINDDAFAVLSLRDTGTPASNPAVTTTADHLASTQHADGGFSWNTTDPSETNTTSAVIQALTTMPDTPKQGSVISRARTFLKTAQNVDGGFPYQPGDDSDSASTAWVVQAIIAIGENPADWQRQSDPVSWLSARILPSGHVEYNPGGGEDSASPLTNAYALMALSGQSLVMIPGKTPAKTAVAAAAASHTIYSYDNNAAVLSSFHTSSSADNVSETPVSASSRTPYVQPLLARYQDQPVVFSAPTAVNQAVTNAPSAAFVQPSSQPNRTRIALLIVAILAGSGLLWSFTRAARPKRW